MATQKFPENARSLNWLVNSSKFGMLQTKGKAPSQCPRSRVAHPRDPHVPLPQVSHEFLASRLPPSVFANGGVDTPRESKMVDYGSSSDDNVGRVIFSHDLVQVATQAKEEKRDELVVPSPQIKTVKTVLERPKGNDLKGNRCPNKSLHAPEASGTKKGANLLDLGLDEETSKIIFGEGVDIGKIIERVKARKEAQLSKASPSKPSNIFTKPLELTEAERKYLDEKCAPGQNSRQIFTMEKEEYQNTVRKYFNKQREEKRERLERRKECRMRYVA